MNNLTKTIVYILLVIAAIFFGGKFYSLYKGGSTRDLTKDADTDTRVSNVVAVAAPADTNTATNAAAVTTNADNSASNAVAATTNAAPETNQAQAVAPAAGTTETPPPVKPKSGGMGMMAYMGLCLASLLVLGFMIAKDFSSVAGQASIDFLFNDDLKGVYDPEYEEALNALHRGQYLPAIQMLREFLQKNPHAQYAALEIAEIYEKNLGNHLAAALEYEEVLKKRLPAERWGWAAIHLCNLYSKMGQTDKTLATLRRIVDEYGNTAAAKKARKRLAMYESGGDADFLAVDAPEGVEPEAAEEESPQPTPTPTPKRVKVEVKKVEAKQEPPAPVSSLPPGFRPKK